MTGINELPERLQNNELAMIAYKRFQSGENHRELSVEILGLYGYIPLEAKIAFRIAWDFYKFKT